MQQLTKIALVAFGLALGCSVNGGARGDFGDGGMGDEGSMPGDDGAGGTGGGDAGESGGSGGSDDGAAAGTGGDDGSTAQEYVDEAKMNFPTYMDLHEKVITRTCTPFSNVCHNNKEYPELDTPLSVLSYFDKECNLPKQTSEPTEIYGGCEPLPDHVEFTSGPNVGWGGTDVAWIEATYDANGATSFEVHLRDPIPSAMAVAGMPEDVRFTREGESGTLTIDEIPNIVYGAGNTYFTVTNAAALSQTNVDNLEGKILGGDLNRDGDFGGEEADHMFRELNPGNPWQSYLLQRVQGNVPGSPMPLANQPLSAAEIVAIACWIEGADTPEGSSVEAVIDYDNCQYAADFGEPPDDSGATLSGHVQPIFDSSCAIAGCHAHVNPAADLDLSAGNSREALIDVPSTQDPSTSLVELGNPTNSYLVKKIRAAADIVNSPMPPAASLSDKQIAVIKLWISYGAPND